ncbi:MAG: sodium:proton antiporter [Gloeomargaritaceae cyanobacterium C42_A2020_066]|nr:sodium:proton antiporter [Gloeomargaritaceae cyanobacterium C42_A2020_066]
MLLANGIIPEEGLIEVGVQRFLLVLSVALAVAALPQIFTWTRRIPYTVLLVLAGLGLSLVDVHLVDLSPDLIMVIFLPPLLFEAAWNFSWDDLKRDWVPVSLYAGLGGLITILGVGASLHWGMGLSVPLGLLVGACLATTDPVSVVALFKELGVGRRIRTLIEGESLFNDGTAVVAFTLLVGTVQQTGATSPQGTVFKFLMVVGIGLAVGALVGFGVSYLTQRFDLPLLEKSLTLVAAYGSYLLTEELGGTGVIATVAAGLILGNFGSQVGMSPRTRVIVGELWEFIGFFVNSILFLLIGDQMKVELLLHNWPLITFTTLAMLLTRLVAVAGLSGVSNRLAGSQIDWRTQGILWWGGLRGGVTLSLALSLPSTLPGRDAIVATLFGVVLFTLLVQGLTIQPLLHRFGLLGDAPLRQRFLETAARQVALSRVLQRLCTLQQRPGIDLSFYARQMKRVEQELHRYQAETTALLAEHQELRSFAEAQLNAELRAIEVDAYAEFVRSGLLQGELQPLLGEAPLEEVTPLDPRPDIRPAA